MENKLIAKNLLKTAKNLISREIEDTVEDHMESKTFYKYEHAGLRSRIAMEVWYNKDGEPIEAIPDISVPTGAVLDSMWEEYDFMKAAAKNRKELLRTAQELKKYAKGLEDLHDYIKELEKKHG